MPSTLLTSGDVTAGAALTSGNDGVLVLQSGTAGAKVDAISLATSGQATLKQPPKLDAAAVVSMIRLNTINGFGSTNTKIRRFLNLVASTGTDITYTDSPTLGASFTIVISGIYGVNYCDQFSVSDQMGISLNTSAPTTNYNAIPATERLTSTTNAGSAIGCAAGTFYLPAGSVLRPHSAGSGPGLTIADFCITRIG